MPGIDFETDYYAILGLESTATSLQVKHAYRTLARQYHPDLSTEPDAVERFQEIQTAYEILNDPTQRAAYDHWRRQQGLDRPPPILVRIVPSHSRLRCLDESQMLYVLVDLTANAAADTGRAPINLCLVLDRSTSMKGERLYHVKQAAQRIVEQLAEQDLLSVVVFGDRARVVVPARRLTNKTAAQSAIQGIQTQGGTEIYYGLEAGLHELERGAMPETLDYLILLTDGRTYGDEDKCLLLAQQAGEKQITLTTLGVGEDWNEDLLDALARLGGGQSYYVESAANIAEVFDDQLQSLGSTYARGLALELHLAEGVRLKQVYRISPQVSELLPVQGFLHLGLLDTRRSQSLIMELLVQPFPNGRQRLAHLDLEANLVGQPNTTYRTQRELVVEFQNGTLPEAPVPADIVTALGKLAIYKMQERAMADVSVGRIEAAIDRLKTMATRLLNLGEAELARAALLEAGRLARTGTLSSAGRKKIRYGTRSLVIIPQEVIYDQMSQLSDDLS